MGAFFEAFFEAIFKILAEIGLSKKEKTPRSKEMSFKEICLGMLLMAVFLGLVNVFWHYIFKFLGLVFRFVKGYF